MAKILNFALFKPIRLQKKQFSPTALSFKNSEIIAEKCLFYSEIP